MTSFAFGLEFWFFSSSSRIKTDFNEFSNSKPTAKTVKNVLAEIFKLMQCQKVQGNKLSGVCFLCMTHPSTAQFFDTYCQK